LESRRPHLAPPIEVGGLPMFERAHQALVARQANVVRDFFGGDHYVLLKSNEGRPSRPYVIRAPFSPTAFGRWKIQFCQAVRRPKIFVSIVSGPAKRRFASMPVNASGDSAARLSTARRTSSSQSSSSGATETRPASIASTGSKGPSWASASVTFDGSPRNR